MFYIYVLSHTLYKTVGDFLSEYMDDFHIYREAVSKMAYFDMFSTINLIILLQISKNKTFYYMEFVNAQKIVEGVQSVRLFARVVLAI